MANIGAQAASAVDEKIREFRTLQTELNTHQSDLGTLMAQRNENEMVKQVSMLWVVWLFVVWLYVRYVVHWYINTYHIIVYCIVIVYF